jgi:hypothetical protein
MIPREDKTKIPFELRNALLMDFSKNIIMKHAEKQIKRIKKIGDEADRLEQEFNRNRINIKTKQQKDYREALYSIQKLKQDQPPPEPKKPVLTAEEDEELNSKAKFWRISKD